MKKSILFIFPFLFVFSSLFGQGIVVQGIARDGNHAAIGSRNLNFQFSITDSNGNPIYTETQVIQTDAYGVFSHVIGNGILASGSIPFTDIDFSTSEMELIITLTYNGSTVPVSNSPFRYVPYAYVARNGVPAGTIMAFVGATAPAGWMLCNGDPVPAGTNLRAIMTNVPDLRGMFLRGTGTNGTAQTAASGSVVGPGLNNFQTDAYENHSHTNTFSINNSGSHTHTNTASVQKNTVSGTAGVPSGDRDVLVGSGDSHPVSVNINSAGSHNHTISGGINTSGRAAETRPVSYGINYIIKL
ncbi:MAG: tail fiber protein [Cytophagales bacterium]|nr:tail fiber protein [Cytophagales bacterium]